MYIVILGANQWAITQCKTVQSSFQLNIAILWLIILHIWVALGSGLRLKASYPDTDFSYVPQTLLESTLTASFHILSNLLFTDHHAI
jgi:hypothetical protein